jgi:hypothetical protein
MGPRAAWQSYALTGRPSRALAVLVLWVLEVSVTSLGVNSQWIQGQAAAERERVHAYWGAADEEQIAKEADEDYQRWFVGSGIVAESYAAMLPRPHTSRADLTLAPWFFSWLKVRLDAFWILVYQGVFRVRMIETWLKFLVLPIGAAALDGYVARQIKKVNRSYASADRFAMGRLLLCLLIAAPFLYLPVPLSVDPVVVPVWGACLMFAVRLLAANAQHQI